MASASSLFTPSLIGLGAPSTRSFASFRPRLVTSRTALMTLILFAPTAVSTTLNSVCSSAGAAAPGAPAPAPATTAGAAAAAAETPRASSSLFTSSAASSSVSALISSTILSMRSDIGFPPEKLSARRSEPQRRSTGTSLLGTLLKLFFLHALLDHVGQVARHAHHGGGEALSGRVDQEKHLGKQRLARRKTGDQRQVGERYDAALNHSGLENESGMLLSIRGDDFRNGHRVRFRIRQRGGAAKLLGYRRDGRALSGPLDQRVLHHAVLSSRLGNPVAQLGVLSDSQSLEPGEQHALGPLQFLAERVRLVLLFFLIHGDPRKFAK